MITTKSAPPTVAAGGQLEFTITVTNNGPSQADDVVVTDTLPPTLTRSPPPPRGVVSGSTVTWNLGTLASGDSVELTVTGTAPSSGTLLNRVSSTADTPDPDPTNNDGTADSSNTSTDVEPAPPPVNQPPVAEDLNVAGQSDSLLLGRVAATDPDADQTLRFTGPVSGPGPDARVMAGGGAFVYRPDAGFAGHDSFTYQVCDNGDPALCDTATVFAAISPVAADDEARTFEETPVLIPVVANDVAGGVLDSIDTDPANGTATIVGGQVRVHAGRRVPRHGHVHLLLLLARRERRPDPVHDGRGDAWRCCRSTTRPSSGRRSSSTTTGNAVSGTVEGTDPDDDTVTFVLGLLPRSGTVVVAPDGSFTYTPLRGFSGVDTFTVIACDDGDPQLCSTAAVTVNVYPIAVDDRRQHHRGHAGRDPGPRQRLGRHERGTRGHVAAVVGHGPRRGEADRLRARRRVHRHRHLRLPHLLARHGAAVCRGHGHGRRRSGTRAARAARAPRPARERAAATQAPAARRRCPRRRSEAWRRQVGQPSHVQRRLADGARRSALVVTGRRRSQQR